MNSGDKWLAGGAFICDFDGTIAEQEVFDAILDRFAVGDWRQYSQMWRSGRITFAEMSRRAASLLRCSHNELMRFLLDTVVLRSGFHDFRSVARELGLPIVIVSAGWDLYVEHSLGEKLLFLPKSPLAFRKLDAAPLYVVCNRLRPIESAPDQWEVRFPWGATAACQNHCAPCKGEVARYLRLHRSGPLITIGDGLTDRCAVDYATTIFARGSLLEYCRANGLAAYAYDTFAEVVSWLRALDRTMAITLSESIRLQQLSGNSMAGARRDQPRAKSLAVSTRCHHSTTQRFGVQETAAETRDLPEERRGELHHRTHEPIDQQQVLQLSHLHPLWGRRRLGHALRRCGVSVSDSTVQRILARHDLATAAKRLLHLKSTDAKYPMSAP